MFGRSLYRVLNGLVSYRNYFGLIKSLVTYVNPFKDFVYGYIFLKGNYPKYISLRTPIGIRQVKLTNSLDTFTVHEIFAWEIYSTDSKVSKVIVDFGSNIGVSEVYFLSRHPENIVYGFEPVPKLYLTLSENVQSFSGRVFNQNIAIADKSGIAIMGVEDSGRYGGIGVKTDSQIQINTLDVNLVLSDILCRHSFIDILKIDIEGLEDIVLEHISDENLTKIKVIYLEKGDDDKYFPENLRNRFKLLSHRGICKYINFELCELDSIV
jgi:FkbM family methyltransferase